MRRNRIIICLTLVVVSLCSFSGVSVTMSENMYINPNSEPMMGSIVWSTVLTIQDTQGHVDSALMGEATDAYDGSPADSYDTIKPPTPPAPFLYLYFDDGLSPPNNKLSADWRHYCDGVTKQWNLLCTWDLDMSPSTIYLSWDSTAFASSEYDAIFLRNNMGVILVAMFDRYGPELQSYSWMVSQSGSREFSITCENPSCQPFYTSGDMNGDGILNIGDVRYLALYLSGDPMYSPLYADGDVNSNGYVNSGDVRYLALYLCGDPDYTPLYP